MSWHDALGVFLLEALPSDIFLAMKELWLTWNGKSKNIRRGE